MEIPQTNQRIEIHSITKRDVKDANNYPYDVFVEEIREDVRTAIKDLNKELYKTIDKFYDRHRMFSKYNTVGDIVDSILKATDKNPKYVCQQGKFGFSSTYDEKWG